MTTPLGDDCRRVVSDISAYLDGDLDLAMCQSVEAHCRDCEACAALVKGLRETAGLCRQAASAPLPDAVLARARERVRRLLDAGTASRTA